MDENELAERLSNYSFYHVIPLTPKLSTPGIERFVPSQAKVMRILRRLDLKGKRILDVGCRDGLYSFEAEKAGASEIIGIDNDLSRAAVELIIPWLQSKVRMEQANLLDLTPATYGVFDVVIFAGVLYHVRYPFLALDVLRDVVAPAGLLVLETAIFVDENRHALLHCPTPADSPYDPTSVSFFNMKGLLDTLRVFGFRVEASELQDHLKPKRTPEKLAIDRVVLLCRRDTEGEEAVHKRLRTAYWKSVHDVHTNRRGPDLFPPKLAS